MSAVSVLGGRKFLLICAVPRAGPSDDPSGLADLVTAAGSARVILGGDFPPDAYPQLLGRVRGLRDVLIVGDSQDRAQSPQTLHLLVSGGWQARSAESPFTSTATPWVSAVIAGDQGLGTRPTSLPVSPPDARP